MSKKPESKVIDDERHALGVFKVLKTFPNGTPRVLERISEVGSTHLQGGEWFVTAYLPESVLADDVKKMWDGPGAVGSGSPEGIR